MKKPDEPPSLAGMLQRAAKSGRLTTILAAAPDIADPAGYPHWEKLRRQPAPEGLSHEEWWLSVKMLRVARQQAIPLRDRAGRLFHYSVPGHVAELLHHIDRGAGNLDDAALLLGESAAPVVNEQTRNQYLMRSLLEEAFTSSRLEGAVTTREIAKQLVRNGLKPRNNSERMVANNYRTMQRIVELGAQPLDAATVFELHRLITEGTLNDPTAAGRFRNAAEQVRVVDESNGEIRHLPPDAGELPARLEAMCAFANGHAPAGFIHPVVRAVLLHFWLAYDHPFCDGNGRTARALFYWAMLRSGFVLFEFLSISSVLLKAPVQYYRAFLHTETDGNDLTYFLLHQAEVVRRALEALRGYLHRKADELQETVRLARGFADLNHRQRALLADALRHPGQPFTIAGHQREHAVVHQTARTDLLALQRLGLLNARKDGRKMLFELAPGAAARLKERATN